MATGLMRGPMARDRIDLRAEPEWIARVRRQAERLQISLSDYLRLATTRQLLRDESDERNTEQVAPKDGQD